MASSNPLLHVLVDIFWPGHNVRKREQHRHPETRENTLTTYLVESFTFTKYTIETPRLDAAFLLIHALDFHNSSRLHYRRSHCIQGAFAFYLLLQSIKSSTSLDTFSHTGEMYLAAGCTYRLMSHLKSRMRSAYFTLVVLALFCGLTHRIHRGTCEGVAGLNI